MTKKETPTEAADRLAKLRDTVFRKAAKGVATATIGDAVLLLVARREQPTFDALFQLLLSDEPLGRRTGIERKAAAEALDEAASKMRGPTD